MKHTSENQPPPTTNPPEGLCIPTPMAIKTRNTGIIGQLLKHAQKELPVDTWKKPPASKDPQQTLVRFTEKIGHEMEWVRSGLEQTANTIVQGIPIGTDVLQLIQVDKTEYNESSLDGKKRKIMERIHAVEEYFARGIIAMDLTALAKLDKFIGIFQTLPSPTEPRERFIINLYHAVGRIMGDEDETKALILSQNNNPIITETRQVLDTSEHTDAAFAGYQKALTYTTVLRYIYATMSSFLEQGIITEEGYKAIKLRILIPMEVNFEQQKGFGVGINIFHNPFSYTPPHADQMEKVLNILTKIQTNMIPGGSEEAPTHYQAKITEGMKLRDIWGIHAIHIVGRHPTPITKDSPLYLHVAIERASGQPPFYAFYNIRTNKLYLTLPDGLNIGGSAELHLHLFALLTDLRRLERSGIRTQSSEKHNPTKTTTIHIPQKRSFVIRKEGIHEGPPPEPTGSLYITPREATLPYGSQFLTARQAVESAMIEKNPTKIQKTQQNLETIARHLPSATTTNLKKYRQKAEALGLDPHTIKVREGKIYAAPREGYEHPTYSTISPTQQVIPAFDAKILEVDQLFSLEDTENNPQQSPENTRQRFWRRDKGNSPQ